MTPLFLFGTLRHSPLLAAVIGSVDHLSLVPAHLPGFSVSAIRHEPFPMIAPDATGRAEGLLVTGLSAQDRARLDYYENVFAYDVTQVTLADGQVAQAYFPPPGRWSAEGAWDLSDWQAHWGELSVLAAAEVMSYKDRKTPDEVGGMFAMIRARAWSRLNAADSRHGALTTSGSVTVSERRRVYSRYFALDEYDLSHSRFDGSMTPKLLRAVFCAPDAALVLPYDPVRDRVLLVEQMRMGPLARGDDTLWQLEPIAGRLDAGETPEAAARREAREEAGLEMGALLTVAETYCSPGNSSEFHYIYVGLTDLPDEAAGFGGLDAENEDIRSHVLPFEEVLAMCDTQAVANEPLVLSAYWLARHRESLRAQAGHTG